MSAQGFNQPQSILQALAEELKVLARAPTYSYRLPNQWVRFLDKLSVLRQLPSVQAQLGAADQVQAIKQAIEQTIDRLYPAVSRTAVDGTEDQASSGINRQVVRLLLGLGPEAEGKTSKERQEIVSRLLDHEGSRYAREIRQGLLQDLAIGLANDLPPSAAVDQVMSSQTPTVHDDYRSARDWLLEFIRQARPERAYLLLHSSVATRPILAALCEVGCPFKLLLCHPEHAFNEFQRRRIRINAQELCEDELAGYDRVEVRWYHTPSSLRGWRIGEYVGLSWYTYHDNKSLPLEHPDQVGVHGQRNPIIIGHVNSASGRQLADWFEGEFNQLWTHRLTVPDEDLYPEMAPREH
jgi:hypothetical protein